MKHLHDSTALKPRLEYPWKGVTGLLVLLLILSAPSLRAQTDIWNTTTGFWETGGNWSPSGPPGAGNTAAVSNGGTAQVTLTSDVASAVTISGTNSTLEITSTGGLTVNGGSGTVAISSGGTLFMNGGTLSATAVSFDGGEVILNGGTFAPALTLTTNGGTLAVAASTSANYSGSISGGTLTIGDATNTGTLTFASSVTSIGSTGTSADGGMGSTTSGSDNIAGTGTDGGSGGQGGVAVIVAGGDNLTNKGTVTGGTGGSANGGTGGTGTGGAMGGFGGRGGTGGTGGVAVMVDQGASLTNDTGGIITGGVGGTANGGAGGQGISGLGGTGGYGGTGGTGGVAVTLAAGTSLTNKGTITGGIGGMANRGDPGSAGYSGNGGNGGNGGVAVIMTAGANITNDTGGSITGGDGGTASGYNGYSGDGDVAIVGVGNDKVINAGTISGGMGYSGQAHAIDFSGGGNTLELEASSSINGLVVSTSGTTGGGDTLALGGTTNASFDVTQVGSSAQYQGFASYLKTDSSTWTLTNTTTAVTPWTIQGGTLAISSDGALGADSGALTFDGGTLMTTALLTSSRDITLDAGGGTVDNDGNNVTLSGAISGAGGLTAKGAGTLILTGSNNYKGGTTVSAGTLQGNTSSLQGDILDNATVVFDQSSTGTYAGKLSGTGSLTKQNTGTLTLSGANSYKGATTISAGTLITENNTAFGTGNVSLTGGTLQIGDGTTAQTLAVGGTYSQSPSGTLALSLHSSTVADQVNVTSTASLGSGTLSINFNGQLASGLGAASSTYDYTLLTSTGLNNTTLTLNTTGAPTNVTATLLYTNNDDDVDLHIVQTAGTFNLVGLTPNQMAVGSYINNNLVNGVTSPLIVALGNAVTANPGELGNDLNELTSLNFANFTSSTAFNNTSFLVQSFDNYLAGQRGLDGTFVGRSGGIDYSGLVTNDPNIDPGLQLVHSRLLAWNPAPSTGLLSDAPALDFGAIDMKDMNGAPCPPQNLWNVFVAGNVVLAQDFSDSATGLSHIDATTGAMQIGADYKITPHVLVGAMFGYGHTEATLDAIGSTASVDTYSPTLYASYAENGWYANALGSYGFDSYTQNRNVAIGAFNGTAHSAPGGDQIVCNLDGGYDFHCHGFTFGPAVGLQYTHLDVNGFTETGLPGADLTVNQNEADSLRSRLGGQVSYVFQGEGVEFTPHLSASWQHEFMDQSRGVTSQFSDVGAGSFVVNTANPSRDSVLADVGLNAQIDKTWTVFADYTVDVGQSNYFGQSVQAGVKIGF